MCIIPPHSVRLAARRTLYYDGKFIEWYADQQRLPDGRNENALTIYQYNRYVINSSSY